MATGSPSITDQLNIDVSSEEARETTPSTPFSETKPATTGGSLTPLAPAATPSSPLLTSLLRSPTATASGPPTATKGFTTPPSKPFTLSILEMKPYLFFLLLIFTFLFAFSYSKWYVPWTKEFSVYRYRRRDLTCQSHVFLPRNKSCSSDINPSFRAATELTGETSTGFNCKRGNRSVYSLNRKQK